MKSCLFSLVLLFCVASTSFATPLTYVAVLNGPSESPVNASPGVGFATVILDVAAHTLQVSASFSGLTGTTTASHIHCCTAVPFTSTAGVATMTPSFVGFPLGVTSGSFNQTYDTSLAATWNAPFITANGGTPLGAEAALAAGLASGNAYYNIHSTTIPGGEIRGFLTVPEPASLSLLGVGLVGLAAIRRRV